MTAAASHTREKAIISHYVVPIRLGRIASARQYLMPRFPSEIERAYKQHKVIGVENLHLRVAVACTSLACMWEVFDGAPALIDGTRVGTRALLTVAIVRHVVRVWLYPVLTWFIALAYRWHPRWMARHADAVFVAFGLCIIVGPAFSTDRLLDLVDGSTNFDEIVCRAKAFAGDPRAGTCANASHTAAGVAACCADAAARPCMQHNHELVPFFQITSGMLYLALNARLPSDLFLLLSHFAVIYYFIVRAGFPQGNPWFGENGIVPDTLYMHFNVTLLFIGARHIDVSLRDAFLKLRSQDELLHKQRAELAALESAFRELSSTEAEKRAADEEPHEKEQALWQKAGVATQVAHRLSSGAGGLPQRVSKRVSSSRISMAGGGQADEAFAFEAADEAELDNRGWVPPMLELTAEGAAAAAPASDAGTRPGDKLRSLLGAAVCDAAGAADRQTALLRVAAQRRDPAFTLRHFLDEALPCLPELRLYMSASSGGAGETSSGRTTLAEYLRTVGALTAVYWLSRLELPSVAGSESLDGQRGFCFGVDGTKWAPPSAAAVARLARALAKSPAKVAASDQKRLGFLQGMRWEKLHALMVDAGVLVADGEGGAVRVNQTRMAAMLALTCIHDIMKLEHLCPAVLAQHAPFHGNAAGDVIRDHDLALGYVLLHDPTALPCFAALPEAQQAAVRFTQADLSFNHGWLVQAQAPPGAIFGQFKKLLTAGSVRSADIAFYFVHWVTDLAGAEPTPLQGQEKFVIKFPQAVLRTIVGSMPIVQRLADTAQTTLFEEYLHFAWEGAALGPPPTGAHAVALMRLLVQAQERPKQQMLRAAFDGMEGSARECLSFEMALTGVGGEAYRLAPGTVGGPALLVYYSPAYLRNCCAKESADEACAALHTLAEVFRAARVLWPFADGDEGAASETVTVMIDELKPCGSNEILDEFGHGRAWVLVRSSAKEATVRRKPLAELPELLGSGKCELLRLWRP